MSEGNERVSAEEDKKKKLEMLRDTFPSLAEKINVMIKAIEYAGKVATESGSAVPERAAGAFEALPVVSLALASFDFIRIPMLYLACYRLGVEPPGIDEKAKMLFAGVLLGLGISALLVPVAAPFLMLGTAATFLTSSVYALYSIQKKIDKVSEKGGDEANALQDKLFDKGVGTGIKSAMVVGAVLSILAVPAAPFIFMAAGLAGGAYLVGKLAAPPLTRLAHWVTGKSASSTTDEVQNSSSDDSTRTQKAVMERTNKSTSSGFTSGNSWLEPKKSTSEKTHRRSMSAIEDDLSDNSRRAKENRELLESASFLKKDLKTPTQNDNQSTPTSTPSRSSFS